MMPRPTRSKKQYIVVFCEGESEQAYIDFLKDEFKNVVSIRRPSKPGKTNLFEQAFKLYKKDPRYRDYAEVTDEIWFFFDVEKKDSDSWEDRLKIINYLRKLRKNKIKVRLLMTTGCLEYWLMLHYTFFIPSIGTEAEKEKIVEQLKIKAPDYKKGDAKVTARIAKKYPVAVENARKTVSALCKEGLPNPNDTDERNCWLCQHCKTFSNVYEAIDFLKSL